MSEDNFSKIVIWDTESFSKRDSSFSILWKSLNMHAEEDVLSIPEFIEKNADDIKARYLAWVYELGQMQISNKQLIEYLEFSPGFSYWWLTLISEKSVIAKSPCINDALRMIAFDKWANKNKISSIFLVSSNAGLIKSLRQWCERNKIPFNADKPEVRNQLFTRLDNIFRFVNYFFMSLIWILVYLIRRRKLIGVGLKEWKNSIGKTTFVSYFDNCHPLTIKNGDYKSNYWANLPEVLSKNEQATNWLHLYVRDEVMRSSKYAASAINKLNFPADRLQNHVTLDAFLSINLIARVVVDWVKLFCMGISLQNKIASEKIMSLDIWPLLKDDWYRSFLGPIAVGNVLSFHLFHEAMRLLPKQSHGLYLQENQAWEFGFIQAWNSAGHGGLTGVPHSTVRFWDLRYFFDPRTFQRGGNFNMPMPSKVACNGSMMLKAYKEGGYPEDELIEVEALRYLHLDKDNSKHASVFFPNDRTFNLLVLGDYLSINTQRQMKLLNSIGLHLPGKISITIKPHPNCPIRLSDYKNLTIKESIMPIKDLLEECDMVYASSSTSAAIDAYCFGLRVLIFIDPASLNLSPLRLHAGVTFIRTPDELLNKLINITNMSNKNIDAYEYFNIDGHLPRWKNLLSLSLNG
jgi:surface carbohydrate biosynthesis protein (TIGR04326 family)